MRHSGRWTGWCPHLPLSRSVAEIGGAETTAWVERRTEYAPVIEFARMIRRGQASRRYDAASVTHAKKWLEPISKSPEEDNEASELYEAEEVLGVVFPTDEDAALPLNPSKEALHEPASHIAA